MKCDKHTMLLYAVTDRAWVGEQTLYQQVESALKGGATCVQLREKHLGDAEFLQEAIEIHGLCQQYGVPLFINDNVDVAVKCHAEGIHVGQSDMAAAKVRERVGEDMMIGVSAHTVQEALDAVAHGCRLSGRGGCFCYPHQGGRQRPAPADPHRHLQCCRCAGGGHRRHPQG